MGSDPDTSLHYGPQDDINRLLGAAMHLDRTVPVLSI